MTDFEQIKILDNFYQTSSFFPMPVVLVSTLADTGQTNLGPYSLCFPHLIAEEDKYAMMLICRDDSNTAMNIKRTGLCAINFIPDEKKYLENCVVLGFPGETTDEKMANSAFTLIPSMREDNGDNRNYPEVVEEAIQIFECTWDRSYPHRLIQGCDNFLLKVNSIHLQKKFKEAIVRGMDEKSFPSLPIDFGFRDNIYFWFAETKRPYKVRIPEDKGTNLNTVMYAAKRFDPSVEWTEAAAEKIVNVPRIFLKRVFEGVVKAAKEEGITVITPEFMDKIRDKRSDEKNN
jgi:flavin reductase (DIM6/NTAB) family NADH-FMN oxidoreductase RutF